MNVNVVVNERLKKIKIYNNFRVYYNYLLFGYVGLGLGFFFYKSLALVSQKLICLGPAVILNLLPQC